MNDELRCVLAGLATVGLITRYGKEGYVVADAYAIADALLDYQEPTEEGIVKLAKRMRKRNGTDS